MIQRGNAMNLRRLGLGCVLGIGLLVGGLVAGDDQVPEQPEPPLRLKKKVRPQPESPTNPRPESTPKEEPKPKKTEPPKPEEPKEDTELKPQDVQEKISAITTRISKNLSQAEDRLQKHDPGEATQQTQRDILRDLDVLIEQTRRQQQQSSSSSSSSSQRKQQVRRNRAQQNQA